MDQFINQLTYIGLCLSAFTAYSLSIKNTSDVTLRAFKHCGYITAAVYQGIWMFIFAYNNNVFMAGVAFIIFIGWFIGVYNYWLNK